MCDVFDRFKNFARFIVVGLEKGNNSFYRCTALLGAFNLRDHDGRGLISNAAAAAAACAEPVLHPRFDFLNV